MPDITLRSAQGRESRKSLRATRGWAGGRSFPATRSRAHTFAISHSNDTLSLTTSCAGLIFFFLSFLFFYTVYLPFRDLKPFKTRFPLLIPLPSTTDQSMGQNIKPSPLLTWLLTPCHTLLPPCALEYMDTQYQKSPFFSFGFTAADSATTPKVVVFLLLVKGLTQTHPMVEW
jgi:hypothetical protein